MKPSNSTLKIPTSSLPPRRRGGRFFSLSCFFGCFFFKWGFDELCFYFLFRYGPIFKSHILGYPCVMLSSPEAVKFVLVTKAHLFKPTFPASKERMLGKNGIFFHQGEYHAKLRRLVLRTFMPESIKNIVPTIESIAKNTIQSWNGQLINTFQEMKMVRKKQRSSVFVLLCFWIIGVFLSWFFNLYVFFSSHSRFLCYQYLEKMKLFTSKILNDAITFLKKGTIRCP